MKRILGIAIVIAFAITAGSAVDCNNDKCKANGKQNTMCKYPDPNPSKDCGRVISVGFTDDERNEIVNEHNRLRSFVAQGLEKRGKPGPQPPAADMQTMVWDDEIAAVAQRWANQCSFGHDQCRDVDRYYVGQNAAITMTTGNVDTKPSDIVKMWYDEVENMNRDQVRYLTDINGVGHYTQLVWAKSNKLGCGKIVFQPDTWNKYYVVCNYGPGGNYMNQPVYQIRN